MKVIEMVPPDRALVESEGFSMEISVSILENVNIGDYVIVHTGFALEIIDENEAQETLKIFHEIAAANEEL